MFALSARQINLGLFLVCVGLLITAYFMQLVMGLEPCPLCMMQRLAVALVGVVALVGALLNPRALGVRIIGAVTLLSAIAGMALSSRQLWLQHLPADKVPECGPGLEYMLEVFPLLEVIQIAIRGTGDCAEVQWTFLGLSIPGWTLLAFIAMAAVAIMQIARPNSASIPK
ncbi:MAG: disulfide bond formation protein B [Hahellaceae bacterium]|nr:disulfide bond formation protein B [Hahellaceae bacterium]MCP5168166.1 disulfide bond formation protein B [Hahellaceae bacterium]